jgi:uncharacterized protein
MRLNVLYELRQAIGATSQYDLEEPRLVVDSLELTTFRGTLGLLRTDRGLLATVRASAKEATVCSRCAKPIECPISIEFKEEYLPFTDPRTSTRVRTYEGEECFRIDDDYVLDLTEGLRQYILTAEPLKPLCKPDCAGLCPVCGTDLNEAKCGCAAQTDERWAALAAFKNESEGR